MTQSSAKVKPITCGFYDCMWKFEGLRSTDGFALSSTWKDASGEKYHRFNADESSGSVEWESLLIVARAGAGPKNAEKVEVADPGQTSSGKLKDPCPICWTTLESSNEGPSPQRLVDTRFTRNAWIHGPAITAPATRCRAALFAAARCKR